MAVGRAAARGANEDGGEMGHIQRSVVINAAPEEVFALLADTGRFGEWVAGFVRLDEGPATLTEDATFRWRMRVLKIPVRVRDTVTEFEPPRQYTEEIRAIIRATLTKTVVPQKRRTQLSWTLDYRLPGGPLGRPLDWLLVHRLAGRAVEQSLQGAKRVLEAQKKPAASRRRRKRQTAVR
jgi:uncharacterized protein YndB with AHSA1/START domain